MERTEGVADTIFIPLFARCYVSEHFPEYFFDEKALSLKSEIPAEGRIDEYLQLVSASRHRISDGLVRSFISQYGLANIVLLGCGLDTMNFRLGSSEAHFYEIDLENVIERRRNVLGECGNETLIGCDMFSFSWRDEIARRTPTLFVASEVFEYFPHEKLVQFIRKLSSLFPGSELVFDATDSRGLSRIRKTVRKNGNDSAMMYFFVDDADSFAYECGAVLLDELPLFADAREMLAGKLKFGTRIRMRYADEMDMFKMIHFGLVSK